LLLAPLQQNELVLQLQLEMVMLIVRTGTSTTSNGTYTGTGTIKEWLMILQGYIIQIRIKATVFVKVHEPGQVCLLNPTSSAKDVLVADALGEQFVLFVGPKDEEPCRMQVYPSLALVLPTEMPCLGIRSLVGLVHGDTWCRVMITIMIMVMILDLVDGWQARAFIPTLPFKYLRLREHFT
jgi:hypothetical protein